MSFLDVLDSIGTGQQATASQAQHGPSATSKPPQSLFSLTTAKSNAANSRQLLNGASVTSNGVKRKVGEAFKPVAEKPSPQPPRQGTLSGTQDRKVPVKPSSQAALRSPTSKVGSPASSSVSTKMPPKGSYAALMAEAKAAQKQRAESLVGQIKHQATQKERISKSERRKREEGEKAMKTKLGKQPQHNSKVEKRVRSEPSKRSESSYKGTAKPAPPVSSYKGTAGRPSQHLASSAGARHKASKQPPRYDEYLATDEEDEGDEIEMGGVDGGYGSDSSSDMEADAFDVEEEENRALREAKADDAREIALENKLKREKEERRRKLEALAKKRR
jgi:SPT2 chromatin protein